MKKFALLVLALGAGAVFAQSGARRDPGDPAAPVPGAKYSSVFTDYRPYAEPELLPWRTLNEEAGRVGGHSGHLSGGKSSGAAAKPVAGPQKPPVASTHGGHK